MDGSLLDGGIRLRGPLAILAFGVVLFVRWRCGTQLSMNSSIDVGRGEGLEAKCAPCVLVQRLKPGETDIALRVDFADRHCVWSVRQANMNLLNAWGNFSALVTIAVHGAISCAD